MRSIGPLLVLALVLSKEKPGNAPRKEDNLALFKLVYAWVEVCLVV